MRVPTDWKSATTAAQLRDVLGVTPEEFDQAVRESKYNYVERDRFENGKRRHLCYPFPGSTLRRVQDAIKDQILRRLHLLPNVRGYTTGAHNINVAQELCPYRYVGNLDVSRYHPSITTRHVVVALQKHGLTWPWARQIARLVTYNGHVPQGAPTSITLLIW
jgi:RNA-directed DNA polymerase